MSEIKLVVFDMAGTTVSDAGQVSSAFVDTLKQHQLEFTPEQVSRVRGSSKRQAVFNFIPEGPDRSQRAEEVYLSFRHHLAHRFRTNGVTPLAGAEEVFKTPESCGHQHSPEHWFRSRHYKIVAAGFEVGGGNCGRGGLRRRC